MNKYSCFDSLVQLTSVGPVVEIGGQVVPLSKTQEVNGMSFPRSGEEYGAPRHRLLFSGEVEEPYTPLFHGSGPTTYYARMGGLAPFWTEFRKKLWEGLSSEARMWHPDPRTIPMFRLTLSAHFEPERIEVDGVSGLINPDFCPLEMFERWLRR